MLKKVSHASLWGIVPVLMILPSLAVAHNGAVALAYPIEGITVDGNLDDWPDNMRRYPITFVEYGDPIKNSADFEGSFQIGYNATENALYVAIEVRDESAAKSWSWLETDGCNMYVDSSHAETDSVADQFITYGYNQTARVSKQAVAWEWKRRDDLCCYEWRLNVDKIGGNAVRLRAGMTLGWDIALCDKDDDGSFSWVAWGRGADKRGSQERCGDVVLVASGQSTGWLKGQVTWQNTLPEAAGENVLIQSLDSDDLWIRTRTNQDGAYGVELPEGRFQVKAGQDRRKSAHQTVEIRHGEQAQADLDVLGARGLTVLAGPGKSVKAVGGWLENRFHLITPFGLTDIRVRAIAQSRDSCLWLATNQGLVRYDGGAFTFFTDKDGLPKGHIVTLTVDHLDRLWIGTSEGLCVYNGEAFTHLTVEDGLIDNHVQTLLEDRAGRIWIGTSRGASVYDGQTFIHFTTENGLRHNDILALLEDRSGRIWIGTSFAGVSIYDGKSFTHLSSKEGLISDRVRSLLEDRSGRIWIGTYDRGVSVYDEAGFTHYTTQDGLADNNVSTLLEDNTGRVWISGSWKGLSVYLYRDGRFWEHASLSAGGGAGTFLQDREGNVWCGTNSGLIRYDHVLISPGTANTLLSHHARTLQEDSAGRIWLGTPSGVSVYDHNTVTRLTEEDGFVGADINSILEDSSGHLWIGTSDNGVSVYDGNSCTRFDSRNGLISNQARSLMEDRSGRVWIATSAGVSVYDGTQFSHFTIEDGLTDNDVRALLEDRSGRVWIGTAYGISVYNGTDFTSITKKDGLVDNGVTCLLEDRSGRIWIGTQSAGVSVYDGKRFLDVTKQDGFVCNNVRTLLEDKTGQIWIGSWGSGVSRYDGKSFQSLTYEDGLPSDTVWTLLEDQQGDIWIGTSAGIVRYRTGHTPPPVSLVDVVTDRRFGPIDEIRLPSTQSILIFEYRALSLKTRPGGMVYRYRLKGYDTEWQTTHSQRVEYHDVPRGNYTFELQAVDRDLSYSEVPVQVAVTVHLPYQLIALWSSAFAAVTLGVWQIVKIRQRGKKLRTARDELERRVEQRTSELSKANAMLTEEISERKRVEVALSGSEQRFRTFFENEPEYCYMVSPQGTILEANSAALSTLGYHREALIGKPLKTIYASECHARMEQLLTLWGKTGQVRDEEMTIITKGGDKRTILLSASHVLDENEETLYSVSIQRDITEQRRLETKERTYQRQLAHVSRLTVAGELASGIAHELNQPLGAIATFSDGCKRLVDSGEAESPEVRDALVQISAQAQRGGEIIRRMRRFVSKHELEFLMTDLNTIVREACRLIHVGEADSGSELSLDLFRAPLTVLVDRIQIQQVVINLIQNGLDSMRETDGTERTLIVRTARSDQDRIEVTVTDRGEGLPEEEIEKAFEPFFTTKPEGLGIGLSISRSIVEVHKGRIWARSNPDHGMTFGFELPSTRIEQTGATAQNAN